LKEAAGEVVDHELTAAARPDIIPTAAATEAGRGATESC
jgi:hypothetical protein